MFKVSEFLFQSRRRRRMKKTSAILVPGVISTFYSRAITQQPQQQNHTLYPRFHIPAGRSSTLGAVLLGAIVAAAVVVDVGLIQGISSSTYVSDSVISDEGEDQAV